MKKLMIALCAIGMAICANAAALDWKTAAVYHGNEEDKVADGSLGYLVVGSTTLNQAAIIAAVSGAESASAVKTWIENNSVAGLDKTTASGKIATTTTSAVNYATGTYDVYAVIFDTATIGESSKVYVSSAKSVTVPGNGTGTANWTATNLADAKTAGAWKAVVAPEPTSGLLMLLGMAGLALRRRRV